MRQVATTAFDGQSGSAVYLMQDWAGAVRASRRTFKALAFIAEEKGLDPRILNSVMKINYDRRSEVVKHTSEMVGGLKGKTIGLFGLAFNPNTDDMREAPSIDIVQHLTEAGAKVRAYNLVAMEAARPLLPDIEMFTNPHEMA